MKIIHFHPDERMAAIFVVPLMNAEREAGYQTELIYSDYQFGRTGEVMPFNLSASNLFSIPLTLWRVWAHIKKRARVEVVFCHNSRAAPIPLLCAKLAGVNSRVYVNHGVPYVAYRGFLRWTLRMLECWNCALATHVLTVSEDMVSLLRDVGRCVRPRVIQHGSACGIVLSDYAPDSHNRLAWRSLNGLRDEDFVVVYVGRPERRKGFELVLRLWAEFLDDTHFKLVLCGPRSDDVLKYFSSVPPNVICLGFVNNVPEVLLSSDMLILPSYHEGLSYACLEALAAGLPVVANKCDGITCVVEHGVSGLLVDNNDIKTYVAFIRLIESGEVIVQSLRQQAKIRAGQFSRDIFMPSYIAFLRELLCDS